MSIATRRPIRLLPAPANTGAAPRLDEFQRRVVEHGSGPALVLAGPGTGKTTALVESVAARVAAGASADRLLVLTFSRRAALELRQRIAARLGRAGALPRTATFHALAHWIVRRFSDPEVVGPGLRLLTAPEQDFRLREVLASSGVPWPTELAAAQGTRGLAAEVREVLARARQLGMDPAEIVAAGRAAGRPLWCSAGEFFEEYLDILDAEQVLDYAELVHRARLLLTDPANRDELRSEITQVYADEYQDCDPAQIGLLRAIVGLGGDLVAFGDPDQSIYAFRGADPRALSSFAERFSGPGRPAVLLPLGASRRFGPGIAEVTRRISDRLPVPPGMDAETVAAFRAPRIEGPSRGLAQVWTCDTVGAEAEHIAAELRRAHLLDGLAWDDMAVIVRAGRVSIPALSRALTASGVPIEVAGDEIPLSAELAVRPLLLGLQVAARAAELGPARRDRSDWLDADEAERLLTSALGALDGVGLRRLGRALRRRDQLEQGAPARGSAELIRLCLVDPEAVDGLDGAPREAAAVRRVALLLEAAATAIEAGAAPDEALWVLWSGTDWPHRLREEATGGSDSVRRANRDLDAVCALFDVAARSADSAGRRGVGAFIAEVQGQQIPADTQRDSDVRGGAVRLLTAHRAKGLQWPLVVVAAVQEGLWPDLRRRRGLLGADELSPDGLLAPVQARERLAEERRLFYIACTRASERLIVSAVNGTEGEGDQPSRFIAELGLSPRALPRRPQRSMTLPGLVAELRRAATDHASPALRRAAAERLARLADATDDAGRALVVAAEPHRWWGMAELTGGVDPGESGAEIVLNASSLGALLACPRQWFLSRRAHADPGRGTAASFGTVIHKLIEHSDVLEANDLELAGQLDRVWERLDFDAAWLSASEREQAEAALERFAAWQDATGREVLGREVPFEVRLTVAEQPVVLRGSVDRLERDVRGRLRVVDFKTSKRPPKAQEVAAMDQLGVYQLVVQLGAFAESTGGGDEPGGAELVFLRLNDGDAGPFPKVFSQASLAEQPALAGQPEPDGPTWVHDRIAEAVRVVREGDYPAQVCDACRYCVFATSCPAQRTGGQVVS